MALLKRGKDCHCTTCGRYAKIYKRRIHKGMARALIALYRAGGDVDYVHVSNFCNFKTGFDIPLTRHWGLVQLESLPPEAKKKKTSGRWRLTPAGMDFVLNKTTVQKFIFIFNDTLLGRDGEEISIRDALGKEFNYGELMAAQGRLF